jgi:hypothetical protein
MTDNNIYCSTINIYGIKIYSYIKNNITLFERKYDTIMTNEMMKETKLFYENLDENTKKNVKFQIYIKCKSMGGNENFMIWWKISQNEFIKDFSI